MTNASFRYITGKAMVQRYRTQIKNASWKLKINGTYSEIMPLRTACCVSQQEDFFEGMPWTGM